MKNLLIALSVGLFISYYSHSQQYNTALGVRGDWSNLGIDLAELSCKHFFDRNNALEANLGFGRRYIWLEGMYHRNQNLTRKVDWYFGAGADFGYWNTNYDGRYNTSERSGAWMGTSGVIGIEYTTDFIPINLSLDAGPTVRMVPGLAVGVKVGFSLRYAFR